MTKNLSPKIVYAFFYNLKIISRITRENRLSFLVYQTFLFIYLFIYISSISSRLLFFIFLFPHYGIEDKSVLKVIADWESFHFELIVRFRFQDVFTYPRIMYPALWRECIDHGMNCSVGMHRWLFFLRFAASFFFFLSRTQNCFRSITSDPARNLLPFFGFFEFN